MSQQHTPRKLSEFAANISQSRSLTLSLFLSLSSVLNDSPSLIHVGFHIYTHMHVSKHVCTYVCVCLFVDVLDACAPMGLVSLSLGRMCSMCFSPFRMSLSFAGSFLFIFHPFIVVHYACPLIFAVCTHIHIHTYIQLCSFAVYRRFYFTLRFMADSCVAFVGHCVFQFVLPLALSYVCMYVTNVCTYVCLCTYVSMYISV